MPFKRGLPCRPSMNMVFPLNFLVTEKVDGYFAAICLNGVGTIGWGVVDLMDLMDWMDWMDWMDIVDFVDTIFEG